jgi:hypothetical protein
MGALCLALAALGVEVRLLVSAPALGILRQLGLNPEFIDGACAKDERAWSRALQAFEPTDCVVDTFPEGLYQEVDPRHASRARWVALLRCRRDVGSERFQTSLARYTEVLDLEPALAWAPASARPFGSVVREIGGGAKPVPADVLLLATEARQRPFLEHLSTRLEHAGVRTLCLPAPGTARSEAALLTRDGFGVKLVVGPAGYNLTYELLALGIWHLALPAARQYDWQELRAERIAAVAHSPDAVERRVRTWLDQGVARRPGNVRAMSELATVLLA